MASAFAGTPLDWDNVPQELRGKWWEAAIEGELYLWSILKQEAKLAIDLVQVESDRS